MNYVKSLDLLGLEVKQIPNITGAGAPTISTEGAVGCQYMDTLTGDIYKCTAVEGGVCTWILTTPVLATTLSGYEPDKTPSVQAVNEGLAGKLDIVSNTYQFKRVYAINEDGTQTRLVASKNASGDVLVQREDGGQITVPGTPDGVYSATSKVYVDGMHLVLSMDEAFNLTASLLNAKDEVLSTQTILVDGFATKEELGGKLDIMTSTGNKVYAQQNGTPKLLGYALVNVLSNVVLYGGVGNGTTDFGGSLQTTTPVNPYNCANKKYVDDTAAAIRTELGGSVKIEKVYTSWTAPYEIPTGALPFFYLESTEFEYSTDGGGYETVTGNFTQIEFFKEDGYTSLGTQKVTSGSFYNIPEGAFWIGTDAASVAEEGGWDIIAFQLSGPITFQVKVGA